MLGADFVIDFSKPFHVLSVLVQLLSCFRMHRVDDEVIVNVISIAVRCDEYTVAWPRAFGELQTDFVRLVGRYLFVRVKGLYVVPKAQTFFLIPYGFVRHKLLVGKFRCAVLTADCVCVFFGLCLFRIKTVVDDRFHSRGEMVGLVCVFDFR